MSRTWIAVPDATVDELLAVLRASCGLYPGPSWVDASDLQDSAPCVFVFNARVVLDLGDNEDKRERAAISNAFAGATALHVDEYQWAELVGYRGSAVQFSVYGAQEDDFVRVSGDLPMSAPIAELISRDTDCDEVPGEIARLLTGIAIDEVEPERIIRLLRQPFARALIDVTDPPAKLTLAPGTSPSSLAVVTEAAWPGVEVLARGRSAIVAACDEHAYLIDLTTWPPHIAPLSSAPCETAALSPWSTIAMAVADTEAANATLLVEIGKPDSPPRYHILPFETVGLLRSVGVGVVVFPVPWLRGASPHLLTRSGALEPLGLPTPGEDAAQIDFGAAPLGDGSFLVRWCDACYRVTDGRAMPLPGLVLPLDHRLDRAVVAHDGSLVVACGSDGLLRYHLDGSVKTVDVALDSPHTVVKGPGDSLIVIDMEPDVMCKVVWPATGRCVPFNPAVFAACDWDPEAIFCDDTRSELVVIADEIYRIPFSVDS